MAEPATAFGDEDPAPQETSTTEPTPISEGDHWLGDEYRDHVSLKDYKSADDMAKSHLSLQAMLGKSIRIPGNDASNKQQQAFLDKLVDIDGVVKVPSDPDDTEGWDGLYNKMGRPEKPEDYGIEAKPETLDLYHQLGMNTSQVRAIEALNSNAEAASIEARGQRAKDGNNNLRNNWGDGYDRNMTNAALAAKHVGEKMGVGDDLYDAMKSDEFLGGELFVMTMAEVGSILGSKNIPLNASAESFNMTTDEVKAQISELRGNEAYMKGEQWALDKMTMLHKKAYPEE